MLLPINWLKDYVDIDVDSRKLADLLTDSGSHVESIISRAQGISGLVTGKILEITDHPNADKLVVCKIDLGSRVETIVTGAPNVLEGQVVIVASVGASLPGGIEIQATDFRGIVSNGMLCSLAELGYDNSVIPRQYRDGIYVFDPATPIGLDVVELLGLDGDILEIEITPNRPDCLSIVGMAREAKATLAKDLKAMDLSVKNEEDSIENYLKAVEIQSPKCKRYYSRVLKDVKIGPSPQWMQNNLVAAGVRPINNMVDITNYVMLELGIPMHAFDLADLRDEKIVVKEAQEGEIFTTLDGQERKLSSQDLVIADGQGTIGIAGVMGGLDSEVKADTKVIVLEGANFSGPSIRHTSKRLGLRTEASSRFEKGLDPELAKLAVERACKLAEEIGAATVVAGHYDIYQEKPEQVQISLRPERCQKLLGVEISKEAMVAYLQALDIELEDQGDLLVCKIPSFRGDLSIEADLIEEVGRLYGLNNIKPTEIYTTMTRGSKPHFMEVSSKLKEALKGFGYNEILTYSFISPKTYDRLMIPQGDPRRDNVRILNPLGEEFSVMRTTLLGNMLDVISRNQNRNIEDMRAYEIGNTFSKKLDKDKIPTEGLKLVMALYGKDDFYYFKESLEKALARLGIKDLSLQREENNTIYHPGRCANVYIGSQLLGTFGEIHPQVMKNFEIKTRTIGGEFDFGLIVEKSTDKITFKALPKYPTSDRDLAIIVDEAVMVAEIKDLAIKNAGDLLESFQVFDIYTGSQIEAGKKSIAFNLKFRSYERTLTDKEVNEKMEKIVQALESELNATLRD
ncbi:MAG: phenylalanine--tRNA ligase subunit beta [Bacillota bacterium]|nr:phenylalanine--tRNA ligase subunit beta [Bacillota bacterium]